MQTFYSIQMMLFPFVQPLRLLLMDLRHTEKSEIVLLRLERNIDSTLMAW